MLVLSICVIMCSTSFVAAFAQPFTGTLIVSFGHSQPEKAAIATLREELPDSAVVQYGSIDYAFYVSRCIGAVVLVGHGAKDGICTDGALIKSEQVADRISSMAAREIIVVSCYSKSIADLDKSGRTFGFSHPVDAELAALEASILVKIHSRMVPSAFESFDKFMNVLSQKMDDTSKIELLREINGGGGGSPPPPPPYFSSDEIFNCALIFVLGCGFSIVGVAVSVAAGRLGSAIAARLGAMSTTSGILGQLYTVFRTIAPAGIGSLLTVVNAIYGGLSSMATVWLGTTLAAISDWIAAMDIVEWALFLLMVGIELVLAIMTAGAEPAIRLAAGIGIAAFNSAIIAIS